MSIIGITGPTGAGKTTALGALKELNVSVIDADAVYHRLLAESEALREALTKHFGRGILDPAGRVDRKRLGAIVFEAPKALAELNELTNPFILSAIDRLCAAASAEGRHAAIDAIGLIESGLGERCSAKVAVLAPPEVRIQRIMAREGISYEYAASRVRAQKSEDFFRTHCAYILENSGETTPEEFYQEALSLFRTLLNEQP